MADRDIERLARQFAETQRQVTGLVRTQQVTRTVIEDIPLADVFAEQKELAEAVADNTFAFGALDDGTGIEEFDQAQDAADTAYEAIMQAAGTAEFAQDVEEQIAPTVQVPAQVAGVNVTGNVAEWQAAGAHAVVALAWEPVVLDTNGNAIESVTYELLVDGLVEVTGASTSAQVTVPSGNAKTFRVRALSQYGAPGDLSAEVTVIAATPATGTLTPNPPVLTTGAGVVVCAWDGSYAEASTGAAHSVRVERKEGDSWVSAAPTALERAGSVTIQSSPGALLEVRLVAYDRLMRPTGTSPSVPIAVKGVELNDIGGGLAGKLESVMLAANGLNRIIASEKHPGDYWLGEGTNHAPPLEGTGEWVEVRRNLAHDPGFTTNKVKLGRTSAVMQSTGGSAHLVDDSWSAVGLTSLRVLKGRNQMQSGVYITDPDDRTNLLLTKWSGKTVKISAVLRLAEKMPDVFSNIPDPQYLPRSIMVGVRTKNGVIWNYGTSKQAPAEAGETRLSVEVTLPHSTSENDTWFIRLMNGSTEIDVWWDALTIEVGTSYGEYFGPGESPGGGLRARSLGAPESSETVLEIERAAGWGDTSRPIYGHVVGVSSWEGEPALRMINTIGLHGGYGEQFTSIPVPDEARSGGVFFGTFHRQEGQSMMAYEPIALKVEAPQQVSRTKIKVGTETHRVEFGQLNEGATASLAVLGGEASVDTWWTNYGLFTGQPNETSELKLRHGDLWWRLDSDGAVVEILIWNGQQWKPYQMVADSIVAAGSIRAEHIYMDEGYADKFWANTANFGRVSVDFLEPNIGSTLNLSANEAIVLMAARQDALSAVFRVVPTGAEVSTQDSSNVVRITPEGVSIVQGGTVASSWTAGQFNVTEAVIGKAKIGSHTWERTGAGRTTVRPI